MTREAYVRRLRQQRASKDAFFRDAPGSPLPPAEREEFGGLSYFPPDPAYRFEVSLDQHEDPEPIVVETTADGERTYRRWGAFGVEIDEQPCTLQAYRPEGTDEGFWVPFRDRTNGEETYGAGRYLDLTPDRHLTDDGAWILDFNEAYNPYCAYSPRYECPLIPMENWLVVRIEAGELAYDTATPSSAEQRDDHRQ